MIQRAVRSQGYFQYDLYPIHIYLWFEYWCFFCFVFFLGKVLFNNKN